LKYYVFVYLEQLDDDENNDKPKLQRTPNNIKENIIINKNVKSSAKFKFCKDNNHTAHKFLSTKIDNRNFTNHQSKIKQNSSFVKTNNSSSKVYTKQNVLHSNPVKTVISKKIPEILTNSQNIIKFDSEINEIVKNSFVNNCKIPLNESCYETSDISQTLRNVDKYMINVQDYLTSSKYVVDKEANSSSAKKTNESNNVHVNRKFQNQLISTNLLNSNSNSLASINKSTSINKKKILKKLSGKIVGSPNLVKIGKTKLIRQSLFRNKWKINNKLNHFENNTMERKPLSTLQCPTSNTLIPSYKKTEWNKVANTTSVLKSKLSNSSNTNKLKWTRPSILLVNNVNNTHPSVPKADKLILFGKNKIIRQSLINPIQSKTKSYMLKHLSHRFALMRKLQQKNIVAKIKTVTSSEQVKNNILSKNTVIKPVEIKRNGKRSYSVYSYVNPILRLVFLNKNQYILMMTYHLLFRSKTNNTKLDKTGSSVNKIPRLLNISDNKPQQNLKIMSNDKNKIQNLSLSNNKILQRLRFIKSY